MAEETKFLFCEGKWSTFMFWPIAEPASCASSVIFLVAAWKGGVREYIDDTTRLLYAILAVCGTGSILFHANPIDSFRFIDEFSIILISTIGAHTGVCDYIRRNIRACVRPALWMFTSGVMAVFWSLTAIQIDIIMRDVLSLFFLCAIPVGVILLLAETSMDVQRNAIEKQLLREAETLLTCGSFVWLIDLLACSKIVSYFYLHAWWHILMAAAINRLIELHCIVSVHTKGVRRGQNRFAVTKGGIFRFCEPQVLSYDDI